MIHPVKPCCDKCGFMDYAKLVQIRVDVENRDVYLDVVCPRCGHTGVMSFVSLVKTAMKDEDTA